MQKITQLGRLFTLSLLLCHAQNGAGFEINTIENLTYFEGQKLEADSCNS